MKQGCILLRNSCIGCNHGLVVCLLPSIVACLQSLRACLEPMVACLRIGICHVRVSGSSRALRRVLGDSQEAPGSFLKTVLESHVDSFGESCGLLQICDRF